MPVNLIAPERRHFKGIMEQLTEKGWTLADERLHPLGSLQSRAVDSYKLVVLLGPKNRYGASYFQAFLRNESGEIGQRPAVIGLYSQGRYPGYNWIEIGSLSPPASSGSSRELPRQLLTHLADLIPPGGHMMVEYDSPEQQDTARALALGIPPVLTPLGYMLFLAGCGTSFKDWHFAEGGIEGPRKLQGYKALNERHALIKAGETAREIIAFLDRLPPEAGSELERAAQEKASAILAGFRRNRDLPASIRASINRGKGV